MKIIKYIDSVLDIAEKYTCIFLLSGLTLTIVIQIILRTVNYPLGWTEELARLMFVWCIYIGTIHAARYGKHLKVDVLSVLVKEKGTYIFRMITDISSVVFFIILAVIMVQVLEFLSIRTQVSASLHFNMIFAYAAPFVCSGVSILRYIEDIIKETKYYFDIKTIGDLGKGGGI